MSAESDFTLGAAQTREVLSFLHCTDGPPSIRRLNHLVDAYVRHVPWESVSRIIKRHRALTLADCPRLPAEFWRDAVQFGAGGTCFEDNYAFFCLLKALGYKGYMTVNDMNGRNGSHAAVVIMLDRRKYLVDVSIPILVAIPLYPRRPVRRNTLLHAIIARPDSRCRYQIERTHHPKRNIYTLVDVPVPDQEYVKVIERDYAASGQFLDQVILVKLIGNALFRFMSREEPHQIQAYDRQGKHVMPLATNMLVDALAQHFRMRAECIEAALGLTRP